MPTASHTCIRIVQSRQNARVKDLRAALARPGAGRVGLEGEHLVEEALRSGLAVETIFVRAGEEARLEALLRPFVFDSGSRTDRLGPPQPELLSVPGEVLRAAVTTEAPQWIAALAPPPVFPLDSVFRAEPPLIVVLAGLQDPGNVGTILRSAEAFGAGGVLALPGTASVWNAKCLRASMGSAFRLPVVALSESETFVALEARSVRSLAAVTRAHPRAAALAGTSLDAPVALWIGNEGSGLAPEVVARCDAAITIPCPGPVESLNAAIAASVLLYEASRQRADAARRLRPA